MLALSGGDVVLLGHVHELHVRVPALQLAPGQPRGVGERLVARAGRARTRTCCPSRCSYASPATRACVRPGRADPVRCPHVKRGSRTLAARERSRRSSIGLTIIDTIVEGLILPLPAYTHTRARSARSRCSPDTPTRCRCPRPSCSAGSGSERSRCLSYFRDDLGQTIVERGLDRVKAGARGSQGIKFLAIFGAVHLAFLVLYFVPQQFFATHGDAWPKGYKSYMINGMCEYPGGAGRCRSRGVTGVPLPRPRRRHPEDQCPPPPTATLRSSAPESPGLTAAHKLARAGREPVIFEREHARRRADQDDQTRRLHVRRRRVHLPRQLHRRGRPDHRGRARRPDGPVPGVRRDAARLAA